MGDVSSPEGSGELSSPRAVREQDRFLPIANIARIMKRALPTNAKIAKDSKETVQECVSEFISFITSEASDKCQKEKRKTINGDDLLWAMNTLGFEDYIEPLKIYLQLYRETEGDTKSSSKVMLDHQSGRNTSTGYQHMSNTQSLVFDRKLSGIFENPLEYSNAQQQKQQMMSLQ